MIKVSKYRKVADIRGKEYDKDLWYDVSNQVFYDENDAVFGVGIIRYGVACLK